MDTATRITRRNTRDESMLQLISLCLCLSALFIFASGLLPSVLYGATLALSLTSAVTFFKHYREQRLPDYRVIFLSSSIMLLLFLFLSPLENVPEWLISSSRRGLIETADTFIKEAYRLGVYEYTGNGFYLSLNYGGTIHCLVYYIAALNVLFLTMSMSRKYKIYFVWFLIFWAFTNAAGGIIKETFLNTSGNFWWFLNIGHSGSFVIGSFVNQNNFGAFLCIILPFVLIFFFKELKEENWNKTLLWGIAGIVIICGVMVSRSRGAYFLCMIACVGSSLWLLKEKSYANKFGAFALSSGLVIFLAFILPEDLNKKFAKAGLESPTRIKIFNTADDILIDMPEGLGPNGYRHIGSSYFINSTELNSYPSHPENEYLQILLDWGPIASVLFMILIIILLKKIILYRDTGKYSLRLYQASFIALIVVSVHALYDVAILVPLYGIVLCAILGLNLRRGVKYDASINSKWQLKLRAIPALGLFLGAAFTIICCSMYGDDIYFKDKVKYISEADTDELIDNIYWMPTNGYNWEMLGKKLLKKDKFEYWSLVEQCFALAARYRPNRSDYWYNLHVIRAFRGDLIGARQAYFRFFMLQRHSARKKLKENFMGLVPISEEDFEALTYMELSSSYLTRNEVDKLTNKEDVYRPSKKPLFENKADDAPLKLDKVE